MCIRDSLSGNAVQAVLHYYRLQTQQMLVVHDELDLPPGQAKLKFSGGHAGHNGLRSIHSHVGPDYWRLRLGIGHPGHKAQVAQWVLDQASLPDRQAIESSLLHCVQHLPVLCQGDLALAQRLLHTSP